MVISGRNILALPSQIPVRWLLFWDKPQFLMKQTISILFSIITLFSSCNNDKKAKTADNGQNAIVETLPIRNFIKKFQTIQLPFYFKGWNGNNIDKSKLFALDFKTTDSLFFSKQGIQKEIDVTIYGYGLLADTTNFYSLIYFEQGEEIYPIICTYSKQGQLISNQSLLVYGCGSDCGLSYCSYAAKINKDYSIYFADTLKYDYDCDSLGNPIPNTDSTFIHSRIGKIDKSGRVNVGEIVNTTKKNSSQQEYLQ